MYNQNANQSYSTYFKAFSAAVFTIGSFLFAKSTGYLFGSSYIAEESSVDGNINTEQNSLGLRRSVEQAVNQTINQQTLQSLQLVNFTPAGNFSVSGIQDMVIKNNIAYIAAGADGFKVFDITNINNVIETGKYQTTGFAHQLQIQGNYAYVAYDKAGLRIVDISNISNISLAGVYMMGTTNPPITKVAVAGNTALVVDENTGEFGRVDITQPTQIFRVYLNVPGGNIYKVEVVSDIAYVLNITSLKLINISNPSNPSLLGSINFNASAYHVSVVGSIAYVMAIDSKSLQLINVSNPSNLSLLSSFPLNIFLSIDGVGGIDVVGGIAYVVGNNGLQLINVSNPSNLSLLSSFLGYHYYDINVVGNIAYIVGYSGLQLLNVSNPTNLSLLGSFPGYNDFGIDVVGQVAYVIGVYGGAAYGLQLINVSNPSNPTLLGFFPGGLGTSVSVVGSIAYVLDQGLQLINVSNPNNPTFLGSFPVNAVDVNVVGSMVYAANPSIGLQVIDMKHGFPNSFDISILENKFINDVFALGNTFFCTEQDRGLLLIDNQNVAAGAIDVFGYTSGISVVGSIAYLDVTYPIGGGSELQLINVSDSINLSLLSNFSISLPFSKVTVVGNIAYIAGYFSLQLLNVSNPTSLRLLSSFQSAMNSVIGGRASVVGSIAYVGATNNLLLIDVSNPSGPSLLGSFNTLGSIYYVSVVDSIAYATDDNASLLLINVSNPSNPTLLGNFHTLGSASGVSLVGSIAIVSAIAGGLMLIDVNDPNNPNLLSSSTTLEKPGDFSVVDFIAYVVDYRLGLGVMNISDPTYPQLVRKYNLEQTTLVSVFGNFAYVLAGGQVPTNLKILNLALEKSNFATNPWTAAQVTGLNNTAYLSDTGKNLYLLDISNTSNPRELSHYALSYHATDMVVSELQDSNKKYIYLYVAQSLDGVEVVDVTNASSPIFAGRITQGIFNARTLQIDGNKLYVNNNNFEILAFDMTVLHYLNVSMNNINLIQGTTTITNAQLNVIAVNPFDPLTNDINNIVYTINNFQQGQFELVNTAIPITSFTQAQINNNNIQFTYTGNGTDPSFDFTLNNGNITAGIYAANIYLIRLPQIVLNKIICNEGQTVSVTQNDIIAIDIDGTSNPNLIFIVNEMGNSQFEYVSDPGIIILQFSQQDIIDKKVQFTQIGSGTSNIASINDIKPFYQLTATNGYNLSSVNNAIIDFDATPQLINNTISINNGETLIIKNENLGAIDFDSNNATLIFEISNIVHGNFTSSKNGTISPINSFIQQDITDGFIKFAHDGLNAAPTYAVSVSDGRANSANQTATVLFIRQGSIPVLLNHQLVVNQGEVVTITPQAISATSTTSDPQQLKFTFEQITNGRFQLVANPGVSIIEFLQSQISNNTVQFAHLGGGTDKPAFKVSVVDGLLVTPLVDGDIDFDAAPQLINNKLTITNGKTVLLTSDYLQATDIDSPIDTLVFEVSSITHGQFKVSTNLNVTNFSQQRIADGIVSFIHDGSGIQPSYAVSVSDGRVSTPKQIANILFTNAASRQMPVLGNHQLFINQNEIITLDSSEISASSASVDSATLLFIVDKIGNGRFQLATEPGIFITQFSQEKIRNGNIQFVHTGSGSDKPSYTISVSDGELSTAFIHSIIDFNAAPQIINNTLNINNGETITINNENLGAIDIDSNNATLLFELSNVEHGKFISSKNGTNNLLINNFIQQDITDGFIKFVHDGLNVAPTYTVSVSDGRAVTANQTATVLFDSTKSASNIPAIIGGVIAGVGSLGLLAAGLGLFAKKQADQSTRNKHRLANYIWQDLKLQGIDNFGTDLGKKYVSLIENNLVPELKQHGYDTDAMEDSDLRELAKKIAAVAKNKTTHSTSFFGSSLITVDDLSRNISNIVLGILEENISNTKDDNYHLLDNDDANIPLKPYVPSMRLSGVRYENV